MDDPRHGVWIPEYETTTEEVMGQEWPLVVVQKWERNGIGERRYVGTRIYSAPTEAHETTPTSAGR